MHEPGNEGRVAIYDLNALLLHCPLGCGPIRWEVCSLEWLTVLIICFVPLSFTVFLFLGYARLSSWVLSFEGCQMVVFLLSPSILRWIMICMSLKCLFTRPDLGSRMIVKSKCESFIFSAGRRLSKCKAIWRNVTVPVYCRRKKGVQKRFTRFVDSHCREVLDTFIILMLPSNCT